jgi:hypothetical protein
MKRFAVLVVSMLGALGATPAAAQADDAAVLIATQTEAMRVFANLAGAWRGPASIAQRDGSTLRFVQTERIGFFLGGSVLVIEGRGYDDQGGVRFNALGIVSYDPAKRAYTIHSHALGRVGDFAFEPTEGGYRWEIPLGPAGKVRYVATVRNGELHEVGERIVEGRPPQRVFEMTLQRIGDTDWPAAGAIPRQ